MQTLYAGCGHRMAIADIGAFIPTPMAGDSRGGFPDAAAM
jgi:hypothetical protein